MRIPSLLLVTSLVGSSAWAQHKDSHNYVHLGFGGVFSETAKDVPIDKDPFIADVGFDSGFSLSGALGRNYRLTSRWSADAEVEVFYQAFSVDDGDLNAGFGVSPARENNAKTFSFMLNGLLEWEFTPQFSIYGGLGLGYAKDIDYSTWDVGGFRNENSDGAAFQGRLGFLYNLGGKNDLLIGYRYFKTEPVDISNATGPDSEIDVAQHSIEVGLRWGL
jgi:opacity protein-like surface antigen